MFMNMYVKFYENLTIGYWDISDLASPIYMVHPVDTALYELQYGTADTFVVVWSALPLNLTFKWWFQRNAFPRI